MLTRLELDHQALRLLEARRASRRVGAGRTAQVFYLRSTGNLSTGGTSVDKTDAIHYDNRIMAERAVKAIGLDVGGVDFISPDITRSYKEVGGAIVEINAAPGFRMHTAPTEGKPRDVAGPVIDMLFPRGHAVPHPHRRHHRHQRQDHHHPHGGAHPQALRLHGRHDHHATASTSTAS